jgi:excisionase family DNA binding protein
MDPQLDPPVTGSTYFTVAEMARITRVPERTIRRWIRSKALPVAYDSKTGQQLVLAGSAEQLATDWHARRGRRRARPRTVKLT